MEELGPATGHEMVLAFVQAEVDSHRFGHLVAGALQQMGLTRALIDHANLTNDTENMQRRELLGRTRGYLTNRTNYSLFINFPDDIKWRRVRLESDDFKLLRYCTGAPDHIRLSGDTRRVVDAAATFDKTDKDA